ncbi:septal ring lytic transglycosylase RlpA family protein [Caballeronia sp. ATUFL_M2_KS44]|uniref:septal ring lytic transglycosylase RlpA family protein n=1 Tax=Caballeronia sp. ATUFL_M2_KS44 TaxID=2921767 RepID=UPI00202906EE|nr:septal ring lytic transglycosylase RlpA family protein [Caballeronia sp. ATUFL_M2_KS44]
MVANAFIRRARVAGLASVGAVVVLNGCAAQQPVTPVEPIKPQEAPREEPPQVEAATASSVDAPAPVESVESESAATPAEPEAASKPSQVGEASFYSSKFQGHRTASGERYDMHALTAAHRTLPLGTYVRVSNLSKTRSVVVRINDRGPFVKGRMIDLSFAAASVLGLQHAGRARVMLEPVEPVSLTLAKPAAAPARPHVHRVKTKAKPMKLHLAHSRHHAARLHA